MLIGELAAAAGVSARALRHYEDRGLLVPGRTANGYRRYDREDVTRVKQIQLMIGAGLGASTIRRYLDCARTDERGTFLHMCPDLRAALDEVAGRLDKRQAQLTETRLRLRTLAAGAAASDQESAVDIQVDTGDVARIGGGQKGHGAGDITGVAVVPDGQ
ncbi:DNA-binding transcriptional MerR regulator [Arthrobacter sp. SLBN-53]|nr:DNA-binding transcriptional MerR regulator [Arthrobacter sp. SLBN-53]